MADVSKPTLVWVDLETTGLDPNRDRILEVAVLITDDRMNLLEAWTDTVACPRRKLRRMDGFVRAMHEGSGLLKAVARCGRPLADVEYDLVVLLDKWGVDRRAVMVGNSVHFDAAFIRRWMPRLAGRFGHQILDVSSVGHLVRRFHPNVYWSMANRRDESGGPAHRALDDIISSLEQAHEYVARSLREEGLDA